MKDTSPPALGLFTETAIFAARAAGSILIERLRLHRQVDFKGEINLVTDADRRTEEAIVHILRSHFPDHQILAEEGSTGADSSDFRWIIDPLDGTTNYAHRYPHFAVSIALEIGGDLQVGVVFDPTLDEMFVAQKGAGAYLNEQKISPSAIDSLLGSLVCTGFPYDRTLFGHSLRRWDYFVRHAQGVRRDGSAALDLCYVAAGRFDGFWEDHLFPWDAAAATLIVEEAGGRVTSFVGGAPDVYHGDIIATNGLIHQAMLDGIEAADSDEGMPEGG